MNSNRFTYGNMLCDRKHIITSVYQSSKLFDVVLASVCFYDGTKSMWQKWSKNKMLYSNCVYVCKSRIRCAHSKQYVDRVRWRKTNANERKQPIITFAWKKVASTQIQCVGANWNKFNLLTKKINSIFDLTSKKRELKKLIEF